MREMQVVDVKVQSVELAGRGSRRPMGIRGASKRPVSATAKLLAGASLLSAHSSGAYSPKLLNGTRHRFSGFEQMQPPLLAGLVSHRTLRGGGAPLHLDRTPGAETRRTLGDELGFVVKCIALMASQSIVLTRVCHVSKTDCCQ